MTRGSNQQEEDPATLLVSPDCPRYSWHALHTSDFSQAQSMEGQRIYWFIRLDLDFLIPFADEAVSRYFGIMNK